MEVRTVSFSRKVSFDRFCNEEACASVAVGPDDNEDEAMARAREIVSKSLAAAEEERRNGIAYAPPAC